MLYTIILSTFTLFSFTLFTIWLSSFTLASGGSRARSGDGGAGGGDLTADRFGRSGRRAAGLPGL
jgi:hypothetical protein